MRTGGVDATTRPEAFPIKANDYPSTWFYVHVVFVITFKRRLDVTFRPSDFLNGSVDNPEKTDAETLGIYKA